VGLTELGWDDRLREQFEPWASRAGFVPARVGVEFNHNFRVYLEDGERDAVLAGRLKHRAASRSDLPAVGDWVVLRQRSEDEQSAIVAVLPRRSRFSRKATGQVTGEQVVAANVDVAFIVMALDMDFSVRRLERYLLLAREGGATAVVLLTKPDRSDDPEGRVVEVMAVAGGAPVHVINPRLGQGIEHVARELLPGRTGALLGSSGVGKTTIINRLVGFDVRRTREVREADSKGRHTTSHRELFVLPGGGLLIDTPGMRELQLWEGDGAVPETFDDIEVHAAHCHFGNCRHSGEPRCAVVAAVGRGEISAERLGGFLKVQQELQVGARQRDERAVREEKRRSKVMGKALKQRLKSKWG
jgi:ribosome biogenesis GTPase